MVAINFDPGYPLLEEDEPKEIASIEWIGPEKKDGSKMRVTTKRKDGSEICSFENYYWSNDVIEECFASAGFQR